ncbi:phosphoribosylaminoimidazolecarboxamide formyltransferase [Clostridium beijerinckii]|uniref:Phosphoribosylaminoimidazolecarboxamide formyltransferase/IMP cyclohydrolase n=1 Tax=Clostridium beijerinckii TaxID=1520 RepID=A0AAE5H3H3_CLOBE|nr:phosphoribosylaminoimidazolecarboxamide formyltransferase [Clostridium beijerinckii]ALB45642.1 phosphoribosylaminoimidazolecarboxamide formyltransferase [Clostridium beijerinckii NRRL B-598]NRT86783.1 phosphoribosylaminoimidazolecarboxamide formyltransferase/IMP cyclohydrolase [Clostridium beijerinckii]NSB14148.1 phosphoribosylaminoimidazolecarboxamide formyltransferase/IMP cyclohydrolase [Clostridium beijerinckii]NYC72215.1 phosphoribosylaminoimidazolecarboxamide formyltransferase/IMP cyclo
MYTNSINLKYGCNPNQKPATIYLEDGELPFKVLNGNPGYINFLDAFNSWQLVKELKQVLKLPAAASFKHVSPAGAAIGIPLSENLKKAYFVDEHIKLSALASAYARARGADRVSSYGDFIALSDTVDVPTAKLIRQEVSDGIIAPAYTEEALKILKEKKKGRYNIIQIDPNYEPMVIEKRKVYGITFEQRRNDVIPDFSMLENIVTTSNEIPEVAKRNLVISMITLKYTQSNSVCLVYDGQVIGCGAGQQSRIHCTRLAASKAEAWYLRQHPLVKELKFREGISRPERDNAIDQYIREDVTLKEMEGWGEIFEEIPQKLTSIEKERWLSSLKDVSLGSDAFFPFRDNIDRAAQIGVKYIVQPGNSIRDDIVIKACNEYGISMAFSDLRLFHH